MGRREREDGAKRTAAADSQPTLPKSDRLLGLRVCVVEDPYRFILNHEVMENVTDDVVAVPIMEETKQRFGPFRSISMDKGFHSKDNQIKLKAFAELVVLPKKGQAQRSRQGTRI